MLTSSLYVFVVCYVICLIAQFACVADLCVVLFVDIVYVIVATCNSTHILVRQQLFTLLDVCVIILAQGPC